MPDRSTRISDAFSQTVPFSAKWIVGLFLVVATLLVNIEYSRAMPFWVRDIDVAEATLFIAAALLLLAGYSSIRQEGRLRGLEADLGFERAKPFKLTVGDWEVVIDHAWKYIDSRSFGLKYTPSGVLKLAYDGPIGDGLADSLKADASVYRIMRGPRGAIIELHNEDTIDDMLRIIEMLQKTTRD